MSPPSPNQDVFDVRKIRRLVELMKEHDLSEIDIREGESRIQLRRGPEGQVMVHAPQAAHTIAHAAPAVASVPVETAAKADESHIATIKCPTVGTFYTASSPDSPPFVKVGDHVGPETTVCIVEAMKVFNQIPAEISGKILSVLVENGQPVEFGQPLYKVDTRG